MPPQREVLYTRDVRTRLSLRHRSQDKDRRDARSFVKLMVAVDGVGGLWMESLGAGAGRMIDVGGGRAGAVAVGCLAGAGIFRAVVVDSGAQGDLISSNRLSYLQPPCGPPCACAPGLLAPPPRAPFTARLTSTALPAPGSCSAPIAARPPVASVNGFALGTIA